jgi:hypothetical protein
LNLFENTRKADKAVFRWLRHRCGVLGPRFLAVGEPRQFDWHACCVMHRLLSISALKPFRSKICGRSGQGRSAASTQKAPHGPSISETSLTIVRREKVILLKVDAAQVLEHGYTRDPENRLQPR